MPRIQKKLQHFKGTICHIFNRGVQKDKIFLEEEDYIFYLKRIKKYKEMYGIEFLNYNLLPNHFHYTIRQVGDSAICSQKQMALNEATGTDGAGKQDVGENRCHLLSKQMAPNKANGAETTGAGKVDKVPVALGATGTDRTPISKFMHVLHNSYAHYFNKKYKRSGHVFQDRYKQRIVEDDAYIMWLSAYINGNAQIHKIVENAKDWPYSSYLDYIGKRNGTICNNKEIIQVYFRGADDYRQYVEEVVKDTQEKKDALKDLEE